MFDRVNLKFALQTLQSDYRKRRKRSISGKIYLSPNLDFLTERQTLALVLLGDDDADSEAVLSLRNISLQVAGRSL